MSCPNSTDLFLRIPPRTALLFAIACTGCGSLTSNGNVTGTVMFADDLVPAGRVIFHHEDGTTSIGEILDGAYAILDVPPGNVHVTVEPQFAKGQKGSPLSAAPFPERYRKPDQSGLTYLIAAGDQVHDILLE